MKTAPLRGSAMLIERGPPGSLGTEPTTPADPNPLCWKEIAADRINAKVPVWFGRLG